MHRSFVLKVEAFLKKGLQPKREAEGQEEQARGVVLEPIIKSQESVLLSCDSTQAGPAEKYPSLK